MRHPAKDKKLMDAVRIKMCYWFTLALDKTGDLCLAMALGN